MTRFVEILLFSFILFAVSKIIEENGAKIFPQVLSAYGDLFGAIIGIAGVFLAISYETNRFYKAKREEYRLHIEEFCMRIRNHLDTKNVYLDSMRNSGHFGYKPSDEMLISKLQNEVLLEALNNNISGFLGVRNQDVPKLVMAIHRDFSTISRFCEIFQSDLRTVTGASRRANQSRQIIMANAHEELSSRYANVAERLKCLEDAANNYQRPRRF